MTGKNKTIFQQIANNKGWTFESIGERWGISERQMSRIANSGNQRDIDAVTGIPSRKDIDMMYEQITHDQALYCATEIMEIHKALKQLARKKDSKERRQSAKQIDQKSRLISAKCLMLEYMYSAAERDDLKELISELFITSLTEATTAMADPEGWKEACTVAGTSPEPIIQDIDDAIRNWRLQFLTAIKTN
jgi:hypothetical protein